MKLIPLAAALYLLLSTSGVQAQGAGGASEGLTESVQRVALTRGGDLNLLISKRTGATPEVGVLLFPGYPGVMRIKNDNGAVTFDLAGNFVIRARRFLNTERVFTVAVDCPVDRWDACGDEYRSSAQHAADISDVIAAVKSQHGARKIYIVGTSYGTVSSSFLAAALGDKIDGAIHTATFTDPGSGARAHGKPMSSFDWSKTKAEQLFIHHKDDPCNLTRYSSIVARKKSIPLISVQGSVNPRGDACQAFTAHGFVGRERVVMNAMHGWIVDRQVPEIIGTAE